MTPAASILETINLLTAMVWTGGLVAVTVATVAARRTLEPQQQVRFFAALGHRYGIVSGLALVLFVISGLIIAGKPSTWTDVEVAIATLTAAAGALTGLGVLNARAVQRLRSEAIESGSSEDAPHLRRARRMATGLRALIAVVTLAAVIVATI